MALSDISDAAAVRSAMAEFDKYGEDDILRKYKYEPAEQFVVQVGRNQYPAKALLGIAHEYQFPTDGPLAADSFPDGAQPVYILQALGFKVANRAAITIKSGRVFGEIPGYPPGSSFPSREALSDARVHGPTQAGISGGQKEGADSIVISGGYADDEDHGDWVIYTGQGGQDSSRKQVADQELTRGNLALVKSHTEGLPVRVTRGARGDSRYSPKRGYRYDGIFMVEGHWHEKGLAGYIVYRYKLVQLTNYIPQIESDSALLVTTPRTSSVIQRIVRNSALSQRVKELYGHCCQVCSNKLAIPKGFYAEGAHIKPLGRPHDGADRVENILCLCPNDHVRLDEGAIYITDDFSVKESATAKLVGKLVTVRAHNIDLASIRYHRDRIANIALHG